MSPLDEDKRQIGRSCGRHGPRPGTAQMRMFLSKEYYISSMNLTTTKISDSGANMKRVDDGSLIRCYST